MSDENKLPDKVRLDPEYDGWNDQVIGWADGADHAEDWPAYIREDVAQAMFAAAYEAAAELGAGGWPIDADAIRALTPDDARAALERVRKEARREEREACAKVADKRKERLKKASPAAIVAMLHALPDAIRARGESRAKEEG